MSLQLVDFFLVNIRCAELKILLCCGLFEFIDLDLFEYFFDHFFEFEIYLFALNINFFDKLIILARFTLFLVKKNVNGLDAEVTLDAQWKIVSILFIKHVSTFPFLFQQFLEVIANALSGDVGYLSPLKLFNGLTVSFGKFPRNSENIGVFVEFVEHFC